MHLAATVPNVVVFNVHHAFDEPEEGYFLFVAPAPFVQFGGQNLHVIQLADVVASLFPCLHSGVVGEGEGVVALGRPLRLIGGYGLNQDGKPGDGAEHVVKGNAQKLFPEFAFGASFILVGGLSVCLPSVTLSPPSSGQ